MHISNLGSYSISTPFVRQTEYAIDRGLDRYLWIRLYSPA